MLESPAKIEQRIARARQAVGEGCGLAHAELLYHAAAQGFYVSPSFNFHLAIACLRAAHVRLAVVPDEAQEEVFSD